MFEFSVESAQKLDMFIGEFHILCAQIQASFLFRENKLLKNWEFSEKEKKKKLLFYAIFIAKLIERKKEKSSNCFFLFLSQS